MGKVELRTLTWLAWGLAEQRKYTTFLNPRSEHHLVEDCSIVGEGKEFIQQSVHAFDTHSVISLTKVEFSKAVYDDPEHFGTEIFAGFRPTFERIDEALRDSWDAL